MIFGRWFQTLGMVFELPVFDLKLEIFFSVAIAEVSHLFPFRTEKLSPLAPMVLLG